MPIRPSSACSYPRCPNLAVKGGRCEQHKKQEQQQIDQQRGTSSERGYNYRWRKTRTVKLNQDPLCQECLYEGLVRTAEEVHHKDGNPHNNDMDNLLSLCKSCHSHITATTQGFAATPTPSKSSKSV